MRTLRETHLEGLKRHPEFTTDDDIQELYHQVSMMGDEQYEQMINAPFPPQMKAKAELTLLAKGLELEEQGKGFLFLPPKESMN